jgi:septal ring factor EnvC (AmiA/AmiB activator)
MSIPTALEAALKRLSAALDHLDAASDRRARADAARGDLEDELAVMQDDRSRLAIELNSALARVGSLDLAYRAAERRLERAGATIRAALGETSAELDHPPVDSTQQEP